MVLKSHIFKDFCGVLYTSMYNEDLSSFLPIPNCSPFSNL